MGEGVKKLEFAPSPYPLPAGERVNLLKLKKIPSPLTGEGQGGGDFGDFFTASGRDRVGVICDDYFQDYGGKVGSRGNRAIDFIHWIAEN